MQQQALLAIGEPALPVGRVRSQVIRGKEITAFRYADSWLRDGFALSPGLPLQEGAMYFTAPPTNPKAGLPGALSDAGPDGWGRTLIRKRLNPKLELDYLLAVDDRTRPGALRLLDEGGQPLSQNTSPIPNVHDLGRLRALCERIDRNPESDAAAEIARELRGTADSLGGARPKAVVIDPQGVQHLAKFTLRRDERPVACLEAATLNLAQALGINACTARLVGIRSAHPTALIERFDRRAGGGRIPYISAQTLLDAKGRPGEAHHYTEIVDRLRAFSNGPHVTADAHELHRRILFMVLMSNTDDHLRNHGFLRGPEGWRLAPAFDVNPQPDRHALLKTGISPDTGFEPSVDAWLEAAPMFGRSRDACRKEAAAMAESISGHWPQLLRRMGLAGTVAKGWGRAVNGAQAARALALGGPVVPVAGERDESLLKGGPSPV